MDQTFKETTYKKQALHMLSRKGYFSLVCYREVQVPRYSAAASNEAGSHPAQKWRCLGEHLGLGFSPAHLESLTFNKYRI